MVPSWTETLIECGVDVVGRTRFCIHPEDKVATIPVFGGTKAFRQDALIGLKADLILLDREENTLEMAEQARAAGFQTFATHIRSIDAIGGELRRLSAALVEPRIDDVVNRWERIAKCAPSSGGPDWRQMPGVIEWLGSPPSDAGQPVVYVIWKDPWMAVAEGTFVASVLSKLGVDSRRLWPQGRGLYPKFSPEEVPKDAVMLLSTEPFPFAKKKAELDCFSNTKALVDGEGFSWFGVRSLEFLERALLLTQK